VAAVAERRSWVSVEAACTIKSQGRQRRAVCWAQYSCERCLSFVDGGGGAMARLLAAILLLLSSSISMDENVQGGCTWYSALVDQRKREYDDVYVQ
jgi:hypothetical protein